MLPIDELWPHWRSDWLLHRGDDLLAVSKPAGVATHPSEVVGVSDVGARLEKWLEVRPRILESLDREASGVLPLALHPEASRALAAELSRGVRRLHVVGCEDPEAAVRAARAAGFSARVSRRSGTRALVKLESHARSQPVRKVLSAAGAPIAGDRDQRGPAASRLMWHLAEIDLGGRRLSAPLPDAMERWLEGTAAALTRDTGALEALVRAAVERRYGLARRGDCDAFRLVHGAGDELPGVEIDRYGDHLVVSLAGDEAVAAREPILDAVHRLGFRGIYLKLRPRKASTLVDTRRTDVAPPSPLRGAPAPEPLWVRELGVEYAVRLGDGLSTGLFLDQRDNRRLLRELAAGKRVLNLFAYHAAFTVAAIAGGAARTVSVDSSGAALERARENLDRATAQSASDGDRHELHKADALAWLSATDERFDLVVLDPPSFSTTRRSTFRAERDYRHLAALAFARLAPGGALLACTNLRRMTAARFRHELSAAASDAGRKLERTRILAPPLDFPPPPGEPWHLKSALAEVRR